MLTVVAEAKSARSASSQGTGNGSHGRRGACHASHNQRSRSARPNLIKSGMPRPPFSIGEHTDVQFTLHCPPESSSSCTQRDIQFLSGCQVFGSLKRSEEKAAKIPGIVSQNSVPRIRGNLLHMGSLLDSPESLLESHLPRTENSPSPPLSHTHTPASASALIGGGGCTRAQRQRVDDRLARCTGIRKRWRVDGDWPAVFASGWVRGRRRLVRGCGGQ